MDAIEIRDLCKAYKEFEISHLNLTLPMGCIMGLVGENGAGKSTTIKLILNAIKRDSGTIKVLGKDNQENFELTKEDIGVVLDEPGFADCFTAKEIGHMMKLIYTQWDMQLFESYLQKLQVPEKKKFKEFSKGMKMKLCIAVALSHQAKLLILDEATSGLDPVVRDEVLDIFSEFTRDENHAVLMSSHIVSDLEKVCDYIAFMHGGKLILCEEKDLLKSQYGIVRCDEAAIEAIEHTAVIGKKASPYGVEAIVHRDKIPVGMEISPVDLEQLFIFMVKGEQ